MQDIKSQEVTVRFFRAIEQLKFDKRIRGKQTLCRLYGINRRHLWILEHNPASDIMKLSWLTILVVDYGISADWLLTGRGSIYELSSSLKPTQVSES